jgi:6-phosphofructokinase 1
VDLIAQKKFGEMVSYQPPIITSVPLESAISNLKLVDPHGELVQIAEGMGVNFGR